jgi:hypothetical protein
MAGSNSGSQSGYRGTGAGSSSGTIKRLTSEGFKSNGAGKSNCYRFFRLLRKLIEQGLQMAIVIDGSLTWQIRPTH